MAFFDTLGSKIQQTGQEAVKKTKDLAEITKLNSQISNEEKVVNSLLIQLGQKCYGVSVEIASINGGNNAAESFYAQYNEKLLPICSQISMESSKIEAMKNEIIRIKNIKTCPNCGSECPETAPFCSICGQKLPDNLPTQQPKAAGFIFCPNCGAQLPGDAAFCTGCGQKV